jgi:5-hydroxyisourate hydrolase-like protein (transthyretin family)
MKLRRRNFREVTGNLFIKTLCASLLSMFVLTGLAEAAPTGISGTVRSFDGTGLVGVEIQVWGVSAGSTDFTYGWSMAGGSYEFAALNPGTYKVFADPYLSDHKEYMPTWYPDEQFMSDADLVTVTADQITPNIDFSLELYGSITGRVTDEATGDPIAGMSVGAFNTTGNQYGILNRTTNANGEYTLYMRNGSYRVHVNTDGTPYKDEYYDNAEDQGSATLIDITEGNTVSDINFALALHTGGSISGRVLDPDGNPASWASVYAQAIVYCDGCYGTAQANMNGYYNIDKLPAADYRVRTSVGSYPDQYYYQQVGENNANPVTVILGQDTPNIDFKLIRGGKITGQVRYPNSDPVEGMYVSASAIGGGGWGNAYADSNGNYEIDTLPPGDYRVHANPVDGQKAADKIYMVQYYNNQEKEEDADPVTVLDEQTASDIDFDLVVGGTISGQLLDRYLAGRRQRQLLCVYGWEWKLHDTGASVWRLYCRAESGLADRTGLSACLLGPESQIQRRYYHPFCWQPGCNGYQFSNGYRRENYRSGNSCFCGCLCRCLVIGREDC